MTDSDIIFSPGITCHSMDRIYINQNDSNFNPISLHFGTTAIFLTPEAFDRLLFEMKAFDAERQLLNGELSEVI
jgi:hypothetical protein